MQVTSPPPFAAGSVINSIYEQSKAFLALVNRLLFAWCLFCSFPAGVLFLKNSVWTSNALYEHHYMKSSPCSLCFHKHRITGQNSCAYEQMMHQIWWWPPALNPDDEGCVSFCSPPKGRHNGALPWALATISTRPMAMSEHASARGMCLPSKG